jgi:hypothetical protein
MPLAVFTCALAAPPIITLLTITIVAARRAAIVAPFAFRVSAFRVFVLSCFPSR